MESDRSDVPNEEVKNIEPTTEEQIQTSIIGLPNEGLEVNMVNLEDVVHEAVSDPTSASESREQHLNEAQLDEHQPEQFAANNPPGPALGEVPPLSSSSVLPLDLVDTVEPASELSHTQGEPINGSQPMSHEVDDLIHSHHPDDDDLDRSHSLYDNENYSDNDREGQDDQDREPDPDSREERGRHTEGVPASASVAGDQNGDKTVASSAGHTHSESKAFRTSTPNLATAVTVEYPPKDKGMFVLLRFLRDKGLEAQFPRITQKGSMTVFFASQTEREKALRALQGELYHGVPDVRVNATVPYGEDRDRKPEDPSRKRKILLVDNPPPGASLLEALESFFAKGVEVDEPRTLKNGGFSFLFRSDTDKEMGEDVLLNLYPQDDVQVHGLRDATDDSQEEIGPFLDEILHVVDIPADVDLTPTALHTILKGKGIDVTQPPTALASEARGVKLAFRSTQAKTRAKPLLMELWPTVKLVELPYQEKLDALASLLLMKGNHLFYRISDWGKIFHLGYSRTGGLRFLLEQRKEPEATRATLGHFLQLREILRQALAITGKNRFTPPRKRVWIRWIKLITEIEQSEELADEEKAKTFLATAAEEELKEQQRQQQVERKRVDDTRRAADRSVLIVDLPEGTTGEPAGLTELFKKNGLDIGDRDPRHLRKGGFGFGFISDAERTRAGKLVETAYPKATVSNPEPRWNERERGRDKERERSGRDGPKRRDDHRDRDRDRDRDRARERDRERDRIRDRERYRDSDRGYYHDERRRGSDRGRSRSPPRQWSREDEYRRYHRYDDRDPRMMYDRERGGDRREPERSRDRDRDRERDRREGGGYPPYSSSYYDRPGYPPPPPHHHSSSYSSSSDYRRKGNSPPRRGSPTRRPESPRRMRNSRSPTRINNGPPDNNHYPTGGGFGGMSTGPAPPGAPLRPPPLPTSSLSVPPKHSSSPPRDRSRDYDRNYDRTNYIDPRSGGYPPQTQHPSYKQPQHDPHLPPDSYPYPSDRGNERYPYPQRRSAERDGRNLQYGGDRATIRDRERDPRMPIPMPMPMPHPTGDREHERRERGERERFDGRELIGRHDGQYQNHTHTHTHPPTSYSSALPTPSSSLYQSQPLLTSQSNNNPQSLSLLSHSTQGLPMSRYPSTNHNTTTATNHGHGHNPLDYSAAAMVSNVAAAVAAAAAYGGSLTSPLSGGPGGGGGVGGVGRGMHVGGGGAGLPTHSQLTSHLHAHPLTTMANPLMAQPNSAYGGVYGNAYSGGGGGGGYGNSYPSSLHQRQPGPGGYLQR